MSDSSESEDGVGRREDYVEIPYRRRDEGPPPPETKELPPIPKDKLLPFKDLYEKQPQRIKDMLRVPFYEGKPVVEPPPLSSFVNRIRKLQEDKKEKKKAERRRIREELVKLRGQEKASTSSRSEPKFNDVEVYETDTPLVHVEYPGRVEHLDKAIETMGGIGNISKVFGNSNRKLHVNFRPDDPLCNSVKGGVTTTIGVLLRVRYRKPKKGERQGRPIPETVSRKKLSEQTGKKKKGLKAPPVSEDKEETVMVNGVRLSKKQILYEDGEEVKKRDREAQQRLMQSCKEENVGETYLKVPRNYKPVMDQKIKIEALGIINKAYKFEGICDFQYLPLQNTKAGIKSERDDLFPVVGTSTDDVDKLFVYDTVFRSEERDSHADLLPPMMSRVEKPVEFIVGHTLDADNVKLTADLKDKTGILTSTRVRRNVYTIFYNFQSERRTTSAPVPAEPLKGAVEDVKKRLNYETIADTIKKHFAEKPIWTRIALQYETRQPKEVLKYVLPYVAYFAVSGPWRNLWIRLGYDPREHQTSFLYQCFDFRVPFLHKNHVPEVEKWDESSYMFRPNMIPPRVQMFYQVCHLKCEEAERLISTAMEKAVKGELEYDPRFGWLKEGSFDYIRHVVTRYIENYLEEQGKISERPSAPKIVLPEGELEPVEKMVHRPHKAKRLRKVRSYKPKTLATDEASGSTSTKEAKQSKGKSRKKGKPKPWAYQAILEDLSIKDINKYKAKTTEEDKEVLDDESLLSDEDFETEDSDEDDAYERSRSSRRAK